MGKNILRGEFLILGQPVMGMEAREKAEELANAMWKQEVNYILTKKKKANIPRLDEGKHMQKSKQCKSPVKL